MKIDIHKELLGRLEDMSFTSRFILNLIQIGKNEQPDPTSIEVEVKINGKEVDVLTFVKMIEDQMDEMVQDGVRKMVKGKLHGLDTIVQGFEERVLKFMRAQFPEARWGDHD